MVVNLFKNLKCCGQKNSSKYSVSVNSNTTGLFTALEPLNFTRDEVIVPPISMSATVITPFFMVPYLFSDIEPYTFCLDPQKLIKKFQKTKAIIVTNLFGHPAKLNELKEISKKFNLYLIEDNAQAPLSSEYNIYAGTIGIAGVFSLNIISIFIPAKVGYVVQTIKN